MSYRQIHENLVEHRNTLRERRMRLLASAQQLLSEADSLFSLEAEVTKMLDNMELRARRHQGTEMRQ